MSNYFHNVLSVSGPHYDLEHFVARNIQIRRDVNHSLAGKIPLFALNAMVPQPADAPLDWADEYWGCRFDTDSIVTLPDMGWNSHCDSIRFAFLTVNAPPYNWFETVAESFPGLHLVMSCVCASSFSAVAFDAQDGQISWTECAGEDFLNNYCTDSAPEEAQPPKYQPPADPDRIPLPRGVVTDCDVHDCLLTPLPEETLVAPPDHLLDDVPWSDLSLPGEQETDDCSLDDEEFEPPLSARRTGSVFLRLWSRRRTLRRRLKPWTLRRRRPHRLLWVLVGFSPGATISPRLPGAAFAAGLWAWCRTQTTPCTSCSACANSWVFPRWIRCACSQLPFMSRPRCALPGTAMRRKIFSVSRKSEY